MTKDLIFDVGGLILYSIIILTAFYYTKRQDKDKFHGMAFEALGSYRFGPLVIAVLMSATMLGPADAMALSQNGLKYGALWAFFPMGAALAQYVSSRLFIGSINSNFSGKLSVGDIFEDHCGRISKIAVGFVTFVQSVAFSGVLVLAGGQILQAFIEIPLVYGMLITAIFVGAYTSVGGMNAVNNTDKIQIVFMIVLLLLSIMAVIMFFVDKPEIDFADVLIKKNFYNDHSLKVALSLFFAYFMGEMLLPAYTIRAIMAKDSLSATNGFLLASIFLAIWYLVITLAGSIGFFVQHEGAHEVILLDIVRSLVPVDSILWGFLGMFVFTGLLALTHSTFDSFLNVGAVAFSRDFMGGILSLTDSQQSWLAQKMAMSIAVLGVIISIWSRDLIEILMIGYTVWVPSLLVPFAWIILNPDKKLSVLGFCCGLIAGVFGWFFFEYVFDLYIPGILAGFFFNLFVLMAFQGLVGEKKV